MENSNFVSQFYNLQGDLISERKKNLFKLLKSQSSPLSEDNLENLHPRNYLERLFEVDIFMYFKMTKKLLEVIESGNQEFVSKILKKPLILKEILGNISGEELVNDFLPRTSYSTRMKILRKMPSFLNELQMDEIIFWVQKRYGFNTAIKILHTCSSKTIENYIYSQELILKPRQIKFIFDRDPQLLLMYLNRYKFSTGRTFSHNSLSSYIASRNPKVWLQLQKEQVINSVSLGYRTSKNFIRHSKSQFLSNIKQYADFLKLDVIVQELHGNFANIYLDFFPKDINNIHTSNFCHKLLRYYPKKKQWDLFAQTFTKVFKIDILDNLIYLNFNFVKLFASKAVINKWARVHYNKDKFNYILKYCDPNEAIPLITEKFSGTSDTDEKIELVELLLENCAENEDFTSLETVLKYICLQYLHQNRRNTYVDVDVEDSTETEGYHYDTLFHILHKILTLFKLEQLHESHWKHINTIIDFSRLTEQMDYYYYTDIFTYALRYIEHLCVHGKSFREELISLINDVHSNRTWFYIDLRNPVVERQIWLEIINIYPDLMDMDNKAINNFVNNIIDFNEYNHENSIDLSNFPGLLAYVTSLFGQNSRMLDLDQKKILKRVIKYNFKFPEQPIIVLEEARILKIFRESREYFCRESFVEKMITKQNRTKFENDVLDIFWNSLIECRCLNKRIIQWLFFNEPRTVLPHIDFLLKLDKNIVDATYIKLMSHMGFDKKVVDYCILKLAPVENFLKSLSEKNSTVTDSNVSIISKQSKEKSEMELYVGAIDVLSTLLSTSEYIEIVAERFLFTDERETPDDESLNQIYFLCNAVAKSLKKMDEATTALPTITKFCFGGILESPTFLCSLYSICYRTPEKILYPYVDQLSEEGISGRRHALFLSCQLLSFNYVLDKLQNVSEDNTSCRKHHVLTAILKLFRKNPCEKLLNLIAVNLNNINRKDEKVLNSLVNPDIPKQYTKLYIEKCWYFFESMRKKEVNVQNYLQLVLDSITRSETNVITLSEDFCRHIITHYFKDLPQRDHHLNNIHRFVCMTLKYQTSEQSYNFKFVFNIINGFKNNKSTEVIKTFFSNFYDIAVEDIYKNNKIDVENNYYIELFKQYWFDTFTPIKMFDEYVLLNLLYLRCKSSENVIESYAQEVVAYLEGLVVEYGPYIYHKFKNLLLHKRSFTEKEKYLFLYTILKIKNSPLNCILVINLLDRRCLDDETNEIYLKIIEILKMSKDPAVMVYFSSYFGLEL